MNCSIVVFAAGDARPAIATRGTSEIAAADSLATALFGSATHHDDSDLLQAADPVDGFAAVAVWGDVAVVTSARFGVGEPSTIDGKILDAAAGRDTYLFAMSSSVDWGAFAWWDSERTLRRSISASADDGIIEDIGTPLAFESHAAVPADDDYPLSFHPLDLVEHALAAILGFVYEGTPPPSSPSPDDIAIRLYSIGEPRRRRGWGLRRKD